jgi:3'(2'), 5'-bisphosphate nucleotidase
MDDVASPLLADPALAAGLARMTGDRLRRLRVELADLPAGELRKQGDATAQELLSTRLATARPEDAVLSEEAHDDSARLLASRVWIVDPLDGTREYGEPPRSDWAVHVALTVDCVPVAGAVALPGLDVVLSTATPPSLPPAVDGPPRLAVSRTRPPACTQVLVDALGATLVEMGSAGAKAMAVVRGEVDVYAHSGGQYEWDSCAPVAVAAAAGLHVSRLDGSPLRYNQPDPYLPDLLICRPELVDDVLEALRG